MNGFLKKCFSCFLTIVICMSSCGVALADNTDYVAIFGDFIHGRNDYNTKLEDFMQANYSVCDFAFFKDCYMVDMNNDSVPELLCIFCDEWGPNEYAVLVEYDNGFKLGAEIPFNYNNGSAGSEFYRILKADGKFYYEKNFSTRHSDGIIAEDEIRQEIILRQNDTDTVVYSAHLKGYTDFSNGTENYSVYVNGQPVDELDYNYVENNFEIVADGFNYGELWNSYTPQFGKDYAVFWNKSSVISVILNGSKISFDQPPIIVDGRTLVPLRAIFEAMGATVNWDGDTQTVTSTRDAITITMSVGKTEMYKNGEQIVLDVPPQLIGDRTLVPVRAVAEGFDCVVAWDELTQTVTITEKPVNQVPPQFIDVTQTMSEEMKYEFNQFVCSEAATAEVAPYNILESYDCSADNDLREILWHFISDYSGVYMRSVPNFHGFENIETIDNNLIRTPSWYWDMIIKEYYNISEEIPQFERLADFGPSSLYYSNYYYFLQTAGRGASEYQAFIEKIYDLGNNQYYFQYKLGAAMFPGESTIDYMYDDTYYAIMERKHINNESFANLEFWSVIKTSVNPLIEQGQQSQPTEIFLVNDLYYGISSDSVINYLGEPESKSEEIYQAATGTNVSEWSYPSKGITLSIARDPISMLQSVERIVIQQPCSLATPQNRQHKRRCIKSI